METSMVVTEQDDSTVGSILVASLKKSSILATKNIEKQLLIWLCV